MNENSNVNCLAIKFLQNVPNNSATGENFTYTGENTGKFSLKKGKIQLQRLLKCIKLCFMDFLSGITFLQNYSALFSFYLCIFIAYTGIFNENMTHLYFEYI